MRVLPRPSIDPIRVNFGVSFHYNATRQNLERQKIFRTYFGDRTLAIAGFGYRALQRVFEIVLLSDLGELLDCKLQILS